MTSGQNPIGMRGRPLKSPDLSERPVVALGRRGIGVPDVGRLTATRHDLDVDVKITTSEFSRDPAFDRNALCSRALGRRINGRFAIRVKACAVRALTVWDRRNNQSVRDII